MIVWRAGCWSFAGGVSWEHTFSEQWGCHAVMAVCSPDSHSSWAHSFRTFPRLSLGPESSGPQQLCTPPAGLALSVISHCGPSSAFSFDHGMHSAQGKPGCSGWKRPYEGVCGVVPSPPSALTLDCDPSRSLCYITPPRLRLFVIEVNSPHIIQVLRRLWAGRWESTLSLALQRVTNVMLQYSKIGTIGYKCQT